LSLPRSALNTYLPGANSRTGMSPEGAGRYGGNRLLTSRLDRVHTSSRFRAKRLFLLTQGKPFGKNGAKIRAVWDEFQGVTRCEPRHRLEAYATRHPRVVAVGARNPRQEAFRDIARHSGKQCSIGFQPVSGYSSSCSSSIFDGGWEKVWKGEHDNEHEGRRGRGGLRDDAKQIHAQGILHTGAVIAHLRGRIDVLALTPPSCCSFRWSRSANSATGQAGFLLITGRRETAGERNPNLTPL
jgi:hypothetical protein